MYIEIRLYKNKLPSHYYSSSLSEVWLRAFSAGTKEDLSSSSRLYLLAVHISTAPAFNVINAHTIGITSSPQIGTIAENIQVNLATPRDPFCRLKIKILDGYTLTSVTHDLYGQVVDKTSGAGSHGKESHQDQRS